MNRDVIAAFCVVMAFQSMQKSDAILLRFQIFHICINHSSHTQATAFMAEFLFYLEHAYSFEINANHLIEICNFR